MSKIKYKSISETEQYSSVGRIRSEQTINAESVNLQNLGMAAYYSMSTADSGASKSSNLNKTK